MELDKDTVLLRLTLTEARELNYHVLKKLDYNCYSGSSKLMFEGIHKKIINAIHKREEVSECECHGGRS